MACKTLVAASDNLVEVEGLKNEATDQYLNGATVTANVTDEGTGSAIAGPITLNYVASSDGDYRGNLADTVTLTKGQRVKITIDANAGPGLQRRFVMFATVVE